MCNTVRRSLCLLFVYSVSVCPAGELGKVTVEKCCHGICVAKASAQLKQCFNFIKARMNQIVPSIAKAGDHGMRVKQFLRQLKVVLEFQIACCDGDSTVYNSHFVLVNDEINAGTGAILERTYMTCVLKRVEPTILDIDRLDFVETRHKSIFSEKVSLGFGALVCEFRLCLRLLVPQLGRGVFRWRQLASR